MTIRKIFKPSGSSVPTTRRSGWAGSLAEANDYALSLFAHTQLPS